ncbi:MAG: leucyl/phenylalanyl-tRNA--protein transferase [Bacteroidetes bacterium]|nr:leucyl/phenylalanyl-tRNA--protein transferase [Bacteroidota bacterium]
MRIYQLTDNNIFPDPVTAAPDGLLAFGGDLTTTRLITAYSLGIFPWYSEEQPILWWSPNPRMVLFPNKFIRHKNLIKTVKSGKFQISFDSMFEEVIELCSSIPRKGQDGDTWITEEMKKAYIDLHKIGIAHSVEVSYNNKIAGGLYGLSIGGCFFGESMFHLVTDASKVALWHLVDRLLIWKFDLIDVQQETEHLRSMGATSVDRKEFLHLLKNSITKESKTGSWNLPATKN